MALSSQLLLLLLTSLVQFQLIAKADDFVQSSAAYYPNSNQNGTSGLVPVQNYSLFRIKFQLNKFTAILLCRWSMWVWLIRSNSQWWWCIGSKQSL